jgi:hypothetical protein
MVDGKHVTNGKLGLKMFTLIVSAITNNFAILYLHSLQRSGKINNNVSKFRLLLDLQAIYCRSAATLETVTK